MSTLKKRTRLAAVATATLTGASIFALTPPPQPGGPGAPGVLNREQRRRAERAAKQPPRRTPPPQRRRVNPASRSGR